MLLLSGSLSMNVKHVLDTHGIDYHETNRRFLVNCPFHPDDNPSAGLWLDSGHFHCWGCDTTIDFVGYLMAALSITRHAALRIARADDDVSDMEDRIRAMLRRDNDPFRYFKVTSFHDTYPAVTEGTYEWKYVTKGRAINSDMVHRFDMRIGVKKYHGRVVLPIYNVEGKLVSYVGRSIRASVGLKTRKSRSPHRTLFGLKEVVDNPEFSTYLSSRSSLNLVLVEGEFDAIYLQQFGIAAVANMGTSSLTHEKIRLIRRYAKRLIISYDGDEAGHRAMYGTDKRGGQFDQLRSFVPTITVPLPEGKDPNDLTEDEVEELYGEYRM